MFTVVKRNKAYKKRKLVIYDGKKKVAEVLPFWGWFSFDYNLNPDLYDKCRPLVMENLYWLLGHDCDFEDWKDSIEAWDTGRHIYGVSVDKLPPSMFFEGEKEIALNSFNN